MQRKPLTGTEPNEVGHFVNLRDAGADSYIVRDISPERGIRRWAFRNPELRFRLKEAGRWKFAAELTAKYTALNWNAPLGGLIA